MTVKKLLNSIHDALDHGMESSIEVKIYDHDSDGYVPVTGFLYDRNELAFETDCDDSEKDTGGEFCDGRITEDGYYEPGCDKGHFLNWPNVADGKACPNPDCKKPIRLTQQENGGKE